MSHLPAVDTAFVYQLAIQSSGKYPMSIFTSTEAAVRKDVSLVPARSPSHNQVREHESVLIHTRLVPPEQFFCLNT